METVSIREARTHLSRLVDQVAAGTEIIIARAGKPVARLVPFEPSPRPKQIGLLSASIRNYGGVSATEDVATPAPSALSPEGTNTSSHLCIEGLRGKIRIPAGFDEPLPGVVELEGHANRPTAEAVDWTQSRPRP